MVGHSSTVTRKKVLSVHRTSARISPVVENGFHTMKGETGLGEISAQGPKGPPRGKGGVCRATGKHQRRALIPAYGTAIGRPPMGLPRAESPAHDRVSVLPNPFEHRARSSLTASPVHRFPALCPAFRFSGFRVSSLRPPPSGMVPWSFVSSFAYFA
jgi:hypothetical protein